MKFILECNHTQEIRYTSIHAWRIFILCQFQITLQQFPKWNFFLQNTCTYIISMNGSVVGVWNWKYFYGQDEGVQLNFDLSLLDENKGKSLHKFLLKKQLICNWGMLEIIDNYWLPVVWYPPKHLRWSNIFTNLEAIYLQLPQHQWMYRKCR